MERKLYNLWTGITSLVLGLMGLAFILVSVFDVHATSSVLIVGLLFAVSGNLLNIIRIRENRKNREEEYHV